MRCKFCDWGRHIYAKNEGDEYHKYEFYMIHLLEHIVEMMNFDREQIQIEQFEEQLKGL